MRNTNFNNPNAKKENVKKTKKTQVPLRLNILFFLVFVLFSALILRLGVVQIVNGESYQEEVDRTENKTVSTPVPRGKIYDRYDRTIVDNEPLNAITYTRAQGVSQQELLKVARDLANLIDMKPEKFTEKLTDRDLKDFWLVSNPEEAKEKLTDKDIKDLTNSEQYQLQLERITEEEIKSIIDNIDELEVAAIFREMNKGYTLTPQIVKNVDVTPKEYAIVSENLEELPGVGTMVDWERKYTYDSTLRSILGKTTTSDEGLPAEKLDYYLARGYNRNDRVGKSYLEEQYEEVLSGQKAIVENITQGHTLLDTNVISDGQRGGDLVLTIDMDLQQAVEEIIEKHLAAAKRLPDHPYLDRAFVVMMDPNTGEVLTMAGKKYVVKNGKVEFQDFALGAMNTAYEMGSAVKGATVLTGYQTGVIQPYTHLYDEPIKIKDTPIKKSYTNMGSVNDLTALRRSSNVYMFRVAMGIAGATYRYNQPLRIGEDAFTTIRRHFNQFGLGVKTGIDLPGETAGLTGGEVKPGQLLDLSIGQYDTYTPLQMAQYVSTIANGGYRMQPKIVKEVRQPTLEQDEIGPILKPFEPTILNRIDMNDRYISQVQEGFRQVMQESGGTAVGKFGNKSYNPAGKTGTAQSVYFNSETGFSTKSWNLTLVGYAPHDNPEVAFSVVVPWVYQNKSNYDINNLIGAEILDKYFELKTKNRSVTPVSETPEQNQTNE
ncbi:peptidoglycan D,D-transpeptidase FtsI family protein [Litchfieldia salsa]|uniref:serine-type D-Ala-D-Ala carboxypeptidase n=1 Tax=Litchfieldia salsa TaxID=930152 RepID=A0A1H0VBA4_9BACI|nr:penicillin-binding protein 2 [Litchfieldia salsa]SDP75710.1 Cell division protein FtsI/penicillin-binding protein 2 [Litchfieldia salsa]